MKDVNLTGKIVEVVIHYLHLPPPKIDEANHIQESTVIMIAIVVIVVFVFVFVTGLLLLRRKDGQRHRRKDQENEITPPTLLSTLTEVEQIKRRRDYVLNCIIHKVSLTVAFV